MVAFSSRVAQGAKAFRDIVTGRGRTVRFDELTQSADGTRGPRYPWDPDYELPDPFVWPFVARRMRNEAVLRGARVLNDAILGEATWRWIPGSARAREYLRNAQADEVQAAGGRFTEEVVRPALRDVSEAALRNADFANRDFGFEGHGCPMAIDWAQVVRDLATVEREGSAVAEVMYRRRTDGLAHIDDIYFIDPRAVHPVATCFRGRPVELRINGVQDPVRTDKLIVLSTSSDRSAPFDDLGAYGAAHFWWVLKRLCHRLLGIGMERWALPTPVVNATHKEAVASGYLAAEANQMVQMTIEAAQKYAAGGQTYLVQSAAAQMSLFGHNAFSPPMVTAVMEFCDRQMLSPVVQRPMLMGTSQVAPRAAVTDQRDDARLANHNAADRIAACMSSRPGPGRGHMARVLNHNFGEQDPNDYPIMLHAGITPPPVFKLLPFAPHLRNASLLTPHNAIEEAILEGVSMYLPLDARRPPAERLAQPNNKVANQGQDLDPSSGGMPASPENA